MLPTIPAKRYFTIGEVAELCEVKPHVLRYWEQEFTQLRPIKRRGNRRYYQHHEVLMIRRIRDLLYAQGFTINGARNRLQEFAEEQRSRPPRTDAETSADAPAPSASSSVEVAPGAAAAAAVPPPASQDDRSMRRPALDAAPDPVPAVAVQPLDHAAMREELLQLRALLCASVAADAGSTGS